MNELLGKQEQLLASTLPVITVPNFSPLPKCEYHKTRILVGRDGFYLETLQPYGRLLKKLYSTERQLPYGAIEEADDFIKIIENHLIPIIKQAIFPEALRYSEKSLEYASSIVFTGDTGEFSHSPVSFTATAVRCRYEPSKLPENTDLVADIHSHHAMSAGFSQTDDADDILGVKIAFVMGKLSKTSFEMKHRYVVEGFTFTSRKYHLEI